MADVGLLWFRCKNADCGYVPDMTRRQIKKLMLEGKSANSLSRARKFIRYTKGTYFHMGDNLYFKCEYGIIPMYLSSGSMLVNSADYPIENAIECQQCTEKKDNERMLLNT